MEITGFFSAIFVGMIIGGLARLIIPNSQPIGCLFTILAGILGAGAGYALATEVFDWDNWALVWAVQLTLAVLLVGLAAAVFGRGGGSSTTPNQGGPHG